MGLQLSSFVRVLGSLVRPGSRGGRGRGGTVPGAPAASPHTAVDVDAVVARVTALGYPAAVGERLRAGWSGVSDAERRQVASPLDPPPSASSAVRSVLLGADPGDVADQVDGTTCGSAVLALLAAAGDPVLAWWLVRGDVLADPASPPVPGTVAPGLLAALAHGPSRPAARFDVLQQHLKERSTAHGLGPLPWPGTFGTPPWGAARVARFGRTRYVDRVVDDTARADLADVRSRVDAALARGVPVPLYAGGDTSRGVATALPRHVVLVAARTADGLLSVYEPSGGAVHAVAADDLWSGRQPLGALGGWTHVCWALLPA